MTQPFDGMTIAQARISEEAQQRTGTLDLSDLGLEELPESLFALWHLRVLDLGSGEPWDPTTRPNRIDAQWERIRELSSLEVLLLPGSDLTSLAPLREIQSLQRLDCSRTLVKDLAPLAGLTALQRLEFKGTEVGDLQSLAGLTALRQLDCSYTKVSDLAPLVKLTALRHLSFSGTLVQDLALVAELTALEQIYCGGCKIADLTPLTGLSALESLYCGSTSVADLTPLAKLTALRALTCPKTGVSDLKPLVRLVDLEFLYCADTAVSNLAPLAELTALEWLNCSNTLVADLAPLAGLSALRQLDCKNTPVADLAPLAGLSALEELDCSGCRLRSLPSSIIYKPSLRRLVLYHSHVTGVPPTGVLSETYGKNCLHSVRAHVADLRDGAEEMADVKLLLLGNGGVGKTQISRWLAGKPFNLAWDSTHGIEIGIAPLPGHRPARLHIWDFGGQDIYLGTHALFLRSPAVLMPVWDQDTELQEMHEHGGLTFRNHPLEYWVELARHQGHPFSPVLIVHAKCDRPEQEARAFPIRDETLNALRYCKLLHVSTKENRGRAALEEALRDGITWLRNPERVGPTQIGAGRLRVQRRLEKLREEDAPLPPERRQHRLLERREFEAICAEEGGVSSPEHLLAYLDANGTVFHRPGLFSDRIVLDQNWALEAIYAVFDRENSLNEIRRTNGRFTRSQLGYLVWREHGEAEQRLFISMMRSCGICFLHRRFGYSSNDDNAEYIAPDLLPNRASIEAILPGRWDADHPGETALFRHALLHEGLIRAVMAEIGEAAGQDALYWKGGLCGFEATTGSRFLVEQEMTGPWQGEIRVRTQRGQAAPLLDQLVELVERAQGRIGMQPLEVERSSSVVKTWGERPIEFAQEKPATPEWYVSYAWGNDKTPEERAREQVVDRLCAAAEERGLRIQRDKEVLGLGESISGFMRRIGKGDRVFVILSDKYLRSPYCMFELSEIWRTSKQEGAVFLQRVRVYALPDAKISEPVDWVGWAIHWKKEHEKLDALAREHGATILGDLGYRRLDQMQRFYMDVSNILGTLSDIVQPRSFEELERYGFSDDLEGSPL